MIVKIRKGDLVEVISGRLEDKGKRGEVIRVLPKADRVVVQGVNMRKKHQRQVQTQGRSLSPGAAPAATKAPPEGGAGPPAPGRAP